MSRNYYYLVASLPYINYGDKPPVSSEEFRATCSTQLSSADAELLQYCSYDPKLIVDSVQATGSDFIDQHLLRERTTILNLAVLRAAKLKQPSLGEPPHDVPRAEAVAKTAFEMDDPLEAEYSIDRGRWGALIEMVGIDYFGVNNVFAYLLKLQLLERRQLFDNAKGIGIYRGLYDTILKSNSSFKEGLI